MFPVFPEYIDGPIIQSIDRSYHIPQKSEVEEANQTSIDFVKYIFSLVKEKHIDVLHMLIHQNPIGYNQVKMLYSAIFSNEVVDSYPTFREDNDNFEMGAAIVEKP